VSEERVGDGVGFTVENGVARILLDRPEVGNAVNLAMAGGLLQAAIRCQTDPDIRCVVVSGAGRLFCAGGDVGQITSATAPSALLSELVGTFHMAVSRLAGMSKPLVTLVNGPAAGAGLSFAVLGDVVLAARSAHFTAAYGAIGLTPDGGLSWLLPRLVGLRKAQEIILTNRRVGADEAEAIGLITRAVDDERLPDEGAALAARLADAPTAAIGAARDLLRQSFESGFETQLEREMRAMSTAGGGAEAREGLAAYLEKRRPDFRGG
jgi:2-(1,2-epoxy-1,2-dihydrophenyl)acetyl-CoA isomerase